MMSKIVAGQFASTGPDVCIMRLEAHGCMNRPGVHGWLCGRLKGRVASFTMVDHDPKTEMSAMMRTTAFPASIVVQMRVGSPQQAWRSASGDSMSPQTCASTKSRRGIKIEYAID